jgi:putative ABC transport system permease protein
MNIPKSIIQGHLPLKPGEILISDAFARKLHVKPNDKITLISSSMYGEMAVYNLTIAGTVAFGTASLDKGTIVADLGDVRRALDMEDATGEILGFSREGYFNDEQARKTIAQFNSKFSIPNDEFSPLMKSLKEQSNMGFLVDYSSTVLSVMIFIFLLAMSIVLWNAGLLGGLRRYGEFGMRLAIGEEKGHVYKTMIYESLLIGTLGSLAGVTVGMMLAAYLQYYGVNFEGMMQNATIIMPTVFKARITPVTWVIGFIPGILSTLIGTMLSGIGIYKRQTAQLFKELEA